MQQKATTTYLRSMKLTGLFLGLLAMIACGSTQTAKNGRVTSLVQLETAPCRGFCPVYSLHFYSNGKVEYNGLRFVEKEGLSSFQLTSKELAALKKKLKAVNLWQYPESFPTRIADAPNATLTVYKGDQQKIVRGVVDVPQPVTELQQHLRHLAEVHGYNLKGRDPNLIHDENRQEVLVRLQPDINAGNWVRDLNQSSGIYLRLLRRTGAENIWVVGFDGEKVTQEDVLLLLRSHESVLEAQPNRAVKERE